MTKAKIILGAVVVIVLVAAGIFVGTKFDFPFKTTVTVSDTQTVIALEKMEQIALLQLGIQGIESQENAKKIFGSDLFGATSTAKFIQYSFQAKLGVDGKNVEITKKGNNKIEIDVKNFIFIGYDNPKFEKVVEKNGILSVLAGDISESDMITKVLNNEAQDKYVEQYKDLLQESAKNYYSTIAKGINPDVELIFKFAN